MFYHMFVMFFFNNLLIYIVYLKVSRVKEDEVARIRLEEKENFRRELDKARKDVSINVIKKEIDKIFNDSISRNNSFYYLF